MNKMLNIFQLKSFEAEIAEAFNAAQIKAPVHLAGGNEQQLINLFSQEINEHDWVCTQWRSHYHALLKNVPPEQLKKDILEGRSITLTYPEQRVISSAIVGGILPIGLGIAASIKRQMGRERVWCFIGDMTAKTGIFNECVRYADGHDLPIRFVIEDNGKSVQTPTQETWGHPHPANRIRLIKYDLPWPHAGAGVRVNF
jgi:pyruvate dehydrogenase E1 component alpha subunit